MCVHVFMCICVQLCMHVNVHACVRVCRLSHNIMAWSQHLCCCFHKNELVFRGFYSNIFSDSRGGVPMLIRNFTGLESTTPGLRILSLRIRRTADPLPVKHLGRPCLPTSFIRGCYHMSTNYTFRTTLDCFNHSLLEGWHSMFYFDIEGFV